MKKWIGLALIGIMFFSSIAFAALQSVTPTNQLGGETFVSLPSQAIIDYKLSPQVYNEALSRGFTVATYSYDKSCVECIDERAQIEQIVLSQEFQNQIILEEIAESGASKLEIASLYGKRTLEKTDANSTISAFCEIVANPPLGCAVR